MYLGYIR